MSQDALSYVEAQGLGSSDVDVVEEILQRLSAVDTAHSRARVASGYYSACNPSNSHFSSAAQSRLLSASSQGSGLELLSCPSRSRSANQRTKRQMALELGLKSLPASASPSSRWRSRGEQGQTGSAGHIYLQAPEGPVTARRGLSGSKVRTGAATPRQRSQTPKSSVTEQDRRAYSRLTSPCFRPQSLKFNQRFSNGYPSEEEEKDQHLVHSYTWNSSEQGLRLVRQVSKLDSSRAMKRASEMVTHRLDPMYIMSGSKLYLQQRYNIDDIEMKRLQEMTQMREGLVSDLKKMKFPYGARAPTDLVATRKPRAQDVDSPGDAKMNLGVPQTQNSKVHPSTPASNGSEKEENTEHQEVESEQSDSDSALAGPQ